MTDSGLSIRLRQQSRRAGLMVGITMVLAIAICIFGAALLYAALARPFSDLVPNVAPAGPIAAAEDSPAVAPAETPDAVPVIETQAIAEPTTSAPAEPTVAPTGDFEATHQIGAGDAVNFRAGPSTSDAIIIALSPATPLEYLDEEQPTTNPADGDRWMRFRTDSGEEGWVREIDTEPFQP